MPYAKAQSPSDLPESVLFVAKMAHQKNQVLVLATGVFDILHQEHQRFLEKAKAAGQVLVVGVESDRRVRILKGAGRPINSEEVRVKNLEAWQIADAVFVLPDVFDRPEDYVAFIHTLRPNILAVSSHTLHIDRKQAIMQQVGGDVKVVHEHNSAISTTKLLTKAAS